MAQIKDNMTPFLTREEIKELIKKMATLIAKEYENKELILICPLRGSIHVTADLMREMQIPLQIDFVQLKAVEKGGAIEILKDISTNIAGKHVLIVEEIIDTGRHLSFLRNRLFASNPASLKIATLLDKPARRELPLKADFIGRTIDDRYVVGYGMDSDELGRNYPDIYFPKH